MKAKTSILTYLLWMCISLQSSDSCPDDWTSLSTGCYKFFPVGSYLEAITTCENEGGFLVEIDNQEEQNALYQFHRESGLNHYVWLGGTDIKKEGEWIGSHSGRIIMDFNGWYTNEPNGGFYASCVFTHPNWGFRWSDYSCSWKGGATALCEYPDQVTTSPPPTSGVWEKGITYIYMSHSENNYKCDVTFYFNVNNDTLSIQFKDSKSKCSDSAPNEDAIHTIGKHFFELKSNLGIRLKCSVGAAMVNETLSRPVLEESLDCVATTDTCLIGWTSLATGCYKFLEAGSYLEAMTKCENEGGYLVEIDNQKEQDAITQFHKDSKLRTYVWLGGTDVVKEGQWIGTHSGREIMKFDGWYKNEPSGGFYESCVWIHINYGFNKWLDNDCSWSGSGAALCEQVEQNEITSVTGLIWEKEMTSIHLRNNDISYECDVSFEFNVNNVSMAIQFRGTTSSCSDTTPKAEEIQSFGKHFFDLSSPFGTTFKCSIGVAFIDGQLSDSILEESLYCIPSSGLCPFGWTSLQTGCYRFVKAGSHLEAMTNCENEVGYLVEIDNQEEQDALTEFHKESMIGTYVWLGGTDEKLEGQWIGNYSGKEIMDFNGWYTNEPNGGFKASCVWVHPGHGFKWEDYDCSWKGNAAALCEYPDQNQTQPIPTTTPGPCPSGWTSLTTGCYQFIAAGSLQEARENCKSKEGYLVEINNLEEQNALALFHEQSKLKTYIWLGATDVLSEGEWIGFHSGREVMNFNGWYRNEPSGAFGENCVWTHYYQGFMKWRDYDCNYIGDQAALCEYNDQNETQTAPIPDPCSIGWTSLDTGCYKFIKAGSHEEANNNCKSLGGYLVEIDNQEEQDALTKFHQKSGLRMYVWLGGTDIEREGQWIGNYTGKEIMNVHGWYRNEPSGGFQENCVWIHINYGFNKWLDYNCAYKGEQAALCEFADQNQTQTTFSPDFCSPGWTSLETGCYQFIPAGSYAEAMSSCESKGGYLAEIDNQEEQDALTLFHQKSKLRQYVWLGGTDIEIEGQWIGGHSGREIMNFNGWYKNEPSGGFDENCVWIHINYGFNKWLDYNCAYKGQQAALCEYNDQNNTETTLIPALIWEKGITSFYVGHDDKSYECDVIFQFNVNNATLSITFRSIKSKCSDSSPKADEIQSFGNHFFSMTAQSGIKLKCSLGVVMLDEGLAGPILEDSLNCFATSDFCPSGWTLVETSCYQFVKAGSYEDAISNCEAKGGFLVEIDNQEEQDVLTQFFEKSKLRTYVWLGGTDVEIEGQWIGSQSGQIMNFTAWRSGEPNGGFKENCIITHLNYQFQWLDTSCSYKSKVAALCEIPDWINIQTQSTASHSNTVTKPTNESTASNNPNSTDLPKPTSSPVCSNATTPACPTVTCPAEQTTPCPTPTSSTILTTSCPACPEPTTSIESEGCHDAGCRQSFNGLGMCLDPSTTDWSNVSKIIDFSAGTQSGKCSRSCNCDCFKHIGCKNPECDAHNGICLIPSEDNDGPRQSFFIPAGYVKAFPCDETINCSCYIKSIQTTSPIGSNSESSCKQIKRCTNKGGKCYGKFEEVPANAKFKGNCKKKSGCKCYKV